MPNIAVIVLDTLRYDRFSEHFGWIPGLRYTNAWSTSHWTGSAHASLLTGRYPTEVGTTMKSRTLESETPIITESLENRGYTTRLVTTNLQIFVWDGWERGFTARYGPNPRAVDPIPEGVLNWREFDETSELNSVNKYIQAIFKCFNPKYRAIPSLYHGVKTFLDWHGIIESKTTSIGAVHNRIRQMNINENEFLLANIMDMHAPYEPPKSYCSNDETYDPKLEAGLRGLIDEPNAIQQSYTDCARYLSDSYRDLHADLLNEFDYVITISDHGELLGESGQWTHAYGLFPELTHVPIVISGRDVPTKEIDEPVSLIDVHQTIADLAEINVESRGQSLLSEIEPVDRLVEYHGLSDRRREKFVEYGIDDLFTQLDQPKDAIVGPDGYAYENQDGFQTLGSWDGAEAQDRLNQLRNSIEREPIVSDKTNTSESIRKRLEALGYA